MTYEGAAVTDTILREALRKLSEGKAHLNKTLDLLKAPHEARMILEQAFEPLRSLLEKQLAGPSHKEIERKFLNRPARGWLRAVPKEKP